jgi:serine/threonine protein kinase HipA of HipAB toxin-antitoxin module
MSNRTMIALIAIILPFAVWSNISLYQKFTEPTVVYQTEVIERVHVEEVLTTIDLEELKDSIKELDEQLYEECLFVIHQHTGDPVEGLRHYVNRHYDGNACQAADEAARGEW